MTPKYKTLTALALSAVITLTACTAGQSVSESAPDTTTTANVTAKPVADDIQTTVTTTVTTVPETTVTTPQTTTTATTPAPETTPPPQTTTTTAAETKKPAPEWTESKASGTMYVNTSCYSRKKAVIGAETVKLYDVNDKVNVTAKTDTGYYKLDNGSFIHGDYLSENKVVVTTTSETTKKPETTPKPVDTEKPEQDTSIWNDENNELGILPAPTQELINAVAWSEEDCFRLFKELKAYYDSVGFTNYSFPDKVSKYPSDELQEFGTHYCLGFMYCEPFNYYRYRCWNKESNYQFLLDKFKKNADNNYKAYYSLTTAKEFKKWFDEQGIPLNGDISFCDLDTAYVLVSNHYPMHG